MKQQIIIIGIDDTDNLESRGTGHLARSLGAGLAAGNLARVKSIARHQLFVHPDIPYTSHNSSASLFCTVLAPVPEIIDYCRNFLLTNSATGSDAGLCIAEKEKVTSEVAGWGRNAKNIILNFQGAVALSQKTGLFLEGLTGTRNGIIGALAAVGLRHEANDGRVLWLPHLRELKGCHKVGSLKALTGIDRVVTITAKKVPENDTINTGDWMRPVIINGKITLFAEQENTPDHEWKIVSKEYIKSISE